MNPYYLFCIGLVFILPGLFHKKITVENLFSQYQDHLTIKIIFSIILAFICTLFSYALPFAIILLVIIIFYFVFEKRGLLFLILASYMTLVGEVNTSLRIAVHILGFGYLIYLFFSEYGLNFNNYKRVPKDIIYLLLLLFSAMFISSLFSSYFQLGIIKIFQMFYFFMIIYIVYSLIKSDKDIKTIIYALIFSALIMALSIIINISDNGFSLLKLVSNAQFRTGGLLSNINALAVFFAVAIPLAISLIYYPMNKIVRVLLIVSIILMTISLITTMSRSALLSTTISVGIILFFFQKKLFFRIFIFSIIFILIIFLMTPISDDLILAFRLSEGLSRRDYLWQLAYNMILANPLTGIGPGAYSYEMFNYFPILLNSYEGQLFIELQKNTFGFNGSHNFYLTLFSDLGILGFIVSLLLPCTFMKIATKTLKFSKMLKSKEYKMLLGFTAIGIGMFIRGFFEGISLITYGWITVDMPFWIIFLLISHYYERLKNEFSVDEG